MKRLFALVWLLVFPILGFSEKLVLVSLNYEVVVDGKYNFLTSINYDLGDYPSSLGSTTITKSLKGVPLKYQLTSTTVSKYLLTPFPRLYTYKAKLYQGNTEIVENMIVDQSKGTKVFISVKQGEKQFSTNLFTNYVECFDLPLVMFFISDKEVSKLSSSIVLYYSTFLTNVSLTNLSLVDEFGNVSDEFVKFKKISDLNVVDRFKLKNVILGVLTNVQVEGRLVDAKIVNQTELLKKN